MTADTELWRKHPVTAEKAGSRWIVEYLALAETERNRRHTDRLARWIYPRCMWGGYDENGKPYTARRQAEIMVDLLDKDQAA